MLGVDLLAETKPDELKFILLGTKTSPKMKDEKAFCCCSKNTTKLCQ